MWNIRFSRAAVKSLLRLPAEDARRIRAAIDALARDPYGMRSVRRLAGQHAYRLRIGEWRVVYLLVDRELIVEVVRVAHRKEVYR